MRLTVVDLQVGALQPADERGMLHATQLGEVARDLQAQNPLWLAMALTHPGIQVCAEQRPWGHARAV